MAVDALNIHWTKGVRLVRILILLEKLRRSRLRVIIMRRLRVIMRRLRAIMRRLRVIIIRRLMRLVLLRHVDVHVFILSLFLR